MTCLFRPRVHPSCPGVLVALKPNKKTFLYSSASSLSSRLLPLSSHILHILFPSLRLSLSVPLPSIKGSLYCLYKGNGVVNRCRVMGSLLAARHGEGRTPPLLRTLTLTPAILFWWIAPTIHLNYVTGNELSVQSGLNEAQGLFLLTLPQHSLLLLITVRACRSDAARPKHAAGSPSLCAFVCVCVCGPIFTATLQLLRRSNQEEDEGFEFAFSDCRLLLHEPWHAENSVLIRWKFTRGEKSGFTIKVSASLVLD